MEPQANVVIDFESVGRKGKARLTVRFPDASTPFIDTVDVSVAAERAKFVNKLCSAHEAMLPDELKHKLDEIAAVVCAPPCDRLPSDGAADADDEAARASLIGIGMDKARVELFHTGSEHDAEAWACVFDDSRRRCWRISSRPFEYWLGNEYRNAAGIPATTKAMSEAIASLAGSAIFDGLEHKVFIRIGEHEGDIWFDLADREGRVARLSPRGWSIESGRSAPVYFARPQGMRGLPIPVEDGSIDEFRRLINIGDDRSWRLLVGFMISAMRPGGPHMILIVNGAQGSAKSFLCKLIRATLDPHSSPLRRPPKDERDLMIAATKNAIVAFDNISGLSQAMSDCLCSLATGGSFGARALFTDDGEKLLDAMRPTIINGIGEIASYPDLLDRAIALRLPSISKYKRRSEVKVRAAFEAALPRVLGALFNACVMALRNQESVNLAELPRMADCAIWVTAAEPALGWKPGTFISDLGANRSDAHLSAIEASPIGQAVLDLMSSRVEWTGTCKALLVELRAASSTLEDLGSRDWPRSPRSLRTLLERLSPCLPSMGVEIEFGHKSKDRERHRLVCIRRIAEIGDLGDDPDDGVHADWGSGGSMEPDGGSDPTVRHFSASQAPRTVASDGADGADDVLPMLEHGSEETLLPGSDDDGKSRGPELADAKNPRRAAEVGQTSSTSSAPSGEGIARAQNTVFAGRSPDGEAPGQPGVRQPDADDRCFGQAPRGDTSARQPTKRNSTVDDLDDHGHRFGGAS